MNGKLTLYVLVAAALALAAPAWAQSGASDAIEEAEELREGALEELEEAQEQLEEAEEAQQEAEDAAREQAEELQDEAEETQQEADSLESEAERLQREADEIERLAAELGDDPAAMDADDEEPGQIGFGANFRFSLINTPSFALAPFFDLYEGHWSDGARFALGGELVLRFKGQVDLVVGYDYADYRTRDGWWLEDDDPAASTDWSINDLRAHQITLEANGIASLTPDGRLQMYGGGGIGIGISVNEFLKYDVNPACLNGPDDLSVFEDGGACFDSDGDPLAIGIDSDGNPIPGFEAEKEDIPNVLPSLVLSMGLRYLIADRVSIGIEAGFKTIAFYAGLEVGFMLGKSTLTREERQEMRDERDRLDEEELAPIY